MATTAIVSSENVHLRYDMNLDCSWLPKFILNLTNIFHDKHLPFFFFFFLHIAIFISVFDVSSAKEVIFLVVC